MMAHGPRRNPNGPMPLLARNPQCNDYRSVLPVSKAQVWPTAQVLTHSGSKWEVIVHQAKRPRCVHR